MAKVAPRRHALRHSGGAGARIKTKRGYERGIRNERVRERGKESEQGRIKKRRDRKVGKKYKTKKRELAKTRACACARACTARHGAGTHAHCSLSCCLYTGPDARRRPSSSTTTYRIVMRDRDMRRVFPPPRGKPSRSRRGGSERRHARTRPADVLSRYSPARVLLRALRTHLAFFLSCLRSLFLYFFGQLFHAPDCFLSLPRLLSSLSLNYDRLSVLGGVSVQFGKCPYT